MREALDDAGVEPMGIAGIGVGAPGSIDAETGIVVQVANIDGWDAAVRRSARRWPRSSGAPSAIGNDVNVAVEAERRFGAGRGFDSFLGVFWGTGVGGGIVLDGRVVRAWLGRRDRPRLLEARRAPLQLRPEGASRPTRDAARSRSAHASSPRSARPCCSS